MKEYRKCKKFIMHDLTATMIESIAKETKLTQSEILNQLLFDYTLNYWSDPKLVNKQWQRWAENKRKD